MAKMTVRQWGELWAKDLRHAMDIYVNSATVDCAGEAMAFTLTNFKLQGFQGDNGFEKWAPRSRSYPWPILHKTGQLISSLAERTRNSGGVHSGTVYTSITKFRSPDRSKGEGPLRVYAAFHNQPSGTYRYPYPNVQRQFIGHSKTLERKLFNLIMNRISWVIPGNML